MEHAIGVRDRPLYSFTSYRAGGVTVEYQRQQAKAMQQYFRDMKLEETVADAQ